MKKVMRNKKVIAMMVAGLVAIFLAASGVVASPPPGTGDPPVESKINYQGQLTDSAGNPLTGTYDMEFQFWDSATGGSQVGSTVAKNGVSVVNGMFNVKLDVNQSDFNGQGLWLEVKVEGETLTLRQEILPVPYALSLKPGAVITGSVSGDGVLHVNNAASGGRGVYGEASNTGDVRNYGGYFVADGIRGRGVYGKAESTEFTMFGKTYGGYFESASSTGTGAYAENLPTGNYAELGSWRYGVFGARGDIENYGALGTINEGVVGYGEVVGGHFVATGEEGRAILASAIGANSYAADFRGNVRIQGSLTGAFPRPAYDSGWVSISQGGTKTLTHNLGGTPDNYVVDMTFKSDDASYGVNTLFYGGMYAHDNRYGAFWQALDSASIQVVRNSDDLHCDDVRVRIWVYE